MSILDYINDYKDKAPANAAGADSVLPEYRNLGYGSVMLMVIEQYIATKFDLLNVLLLIKLREVTDFLKFEEKTSDKSLYLFGLKE